MAEESAQERNEAPTPRRREKARTEGQVPRSQEFLTAVLILAGGSVLASVGGPMLGASAEGTLRQAAGWMTLGPLTEVGASSMLRDVTRATLMAILPVLLLIIAPVVLVGGIQARGILSAKPLAPDFSRIDPRSGIKRVIGLQGVVTLLKSLLKLVALGAITWVALSTAWDGFASLTGADAPTVIAATRATVLRLVFLTGIAFLATALADYGYEVFKHEKQMKMSKQEIIQEHRESEGDPMVKSRMRSLAQAMTRKRMLHKVKEADVVIVNPTEIAVAIKYDGGEASAPVVLAMGRRKLAQKIRELAKDANVPIVQNIPVARALIGSAVVGKPIPPALYAAVAEVLAFVYRMRGHLPQGLQQRRGAR